MDDLFQVAGVREVLGHGVEHDRVEVALWKVVEVVGGLGAEVYPRGQDGIGTDVPPKLVDDGAGEVGAPVLLALGRQPGQEQPGADTDFEDAARPQGPDAVDGRVTPLPHLGQRDRPAVVTAVPTGEVLAERCLLRSVVHGVVQVLPLAELVLLHSLVVVARRGVGYDVGDEPGVTGLVLADDDGCLRDVRVVGEDLLDLAEFDAEASDLDLVVDAPDELQLAVLVPTHQVTGAVHTSTGLGSVRVRHESLGRQAGLVQIAAGHTGSRDVQLPHHTGRHQLQPRTQHVGTRVGDRSADRRGARAAGQVRGGRPDGGLCGAVQVGQVVGERAHRLGERCGQRLTADQDAQAPKRLRLVRHQELPQRGGALYDRDAVPGDQVEHGGRLRDGLLGGEDHCGARKERVVQLQRSDVERHRGDREQPFPRPERDLAPHGFQEVEQRRVRDDHALGATGRA
ncbi:hypothetical protein EES46_15830 [Streptomyces sp. ADI98-10]|nr:hypothetical protein EES46_15830 [Streptomyces sp. ADI98-10]